MKILAFLLLAAPLAVSAQQTAYHIEGTASHDLPRSKVYLSYTDVTKKNRVDSTWTANGRFEFTGSVDQPVYARLLIDRSGKGIYKVSPGNKRTLYIEPGTMTVKIKDSLATSPVKGAKLNDDNNKLLSLLQPARRKMDSLYLTHKGTFKENKDAKDAYDQAGLKFITANPSSAVSMEFLKTFGGSGAEYDQLAPIFEHLSPEIKNSPDGKIFAAKLERLKNLVIGKMAPDFEQTDTAGKLIHLHDFKGKYVLVDFWASWCGPCRAENPNLVAAYHRFHAKGFNVLGVSLDGPTSKNAWIKAIKTDGLEWAQVSDLKFWNNEVSRKFNVSSIPQNFLIGPDGKIVAKNLRGEELNQKLSEIFGAM